jgi:hypothetical protein
MCVWRKKMYKKPRPGSIADLTVCSSSPIEHVCMSLEDNQEKEKNSRRNSKLFFSLQEEGG